MQQEEIRNGSAAPNVTDTAISLPDNVFQMEEQSDSLTENEMAVRAIDDNMFSDFQAALSEPQNPPSIFSSDARNQNKIPDDLKKKRKGSSLWNFFSDLGNQQARCHACDKILSYKSSLTNLLAHRKTRHPDLPTFKITKERGVVVIQGDTSSLSRLNRGDPDSNQKKNRRKSHLWKYFTLIDNVSAECNICKKKLSHKWTLTNLLKHKVRKHPTIRLNPHFRPAGAKSFGNNSFFSQDISHTHAMYIDDGPGFKKPSDNFGNSSEDEIIPMTSGKTTRKRRSKIWRFFRIVGDYVAQCKSCQKRFSFKSSASNLMNHLEKKHNATYLLLKNGKDPRSRKASSKSLAQAIDSFIRIQLPDVSSALQQDAINSKNSNNYNMDNCDTMHQTDLYSSSDMLNNASSSASYSSASSIHQELEVPTSCSSTDTVNQESTKNFSAADDVYQEIEVSTSCSLAHTVNPDPISAIDSVHHEIEISTSYNLSDALNPESTNTCSAIDFVHQEIEVATTYRLSDTPNSESKSTYSATNDVHQDIEVSTSLSLSDALSQEPTSTYRTIDSVHQEIEGATSYSLSDTPNSESKSTYSATNDVHQDIEVSTSLSLSDALSQEASAYNIPNSIQQALDIIASYSSTDAISHDTSTAHSAHQEFEIASSCSLTETLKQELKSACSAENNVQQELAIPSAYSLTDTPSGESTRAYNTAKSIEQELDAPITYSSNNRLNQLSAAGSTDLELDLTTIFNSIDTLSQASTSSAYSTAGNVHQEPVIVNSYDAIGQDPSMYSNLSSYKLPIVFVGEDSSSPTKRNQDTQSQKTSISHRPINASPEVVTVRSESTLAESQLVSVVKEGNQLLRGMQAAIEKQSEILLKLTNCIENLVRSKT